MHACTLALGASEVLRVLINGESLINNGVGTFFYTVIDNFLDPAIDSGAFEVVMTNLVLQFLKVAIGGPILGYIFAKLAMMSVSRVFNDAPVEITVTLVSLFTIQNWILLVF